jgi:flagellin
MDVNLSKAVRSNLLSLQSTAAAMAKTQSKLATGLKVNSALDNPSSFFTASALNSRAGDMANLMDSMSSGIKTIEAADNGLKSITKTVESMQSTLRQARQDKSNKTASYTLDPTTIDTSAVQNISISGGAVGSAVNVALNTADTTVAAHQADVTATNSFVGLDTGESASFKVNGTTVSLDDTTGATIGAAVTEIQSQLDTAFGANSFTVSDNSGKLEIKGKSDGSNSVTISSVTNPTTGVTGFVNAQTDAGTVAGTVDGVVKSVDTLVSNINGNAALKDKVRASNDGGKLRIENLSTTDLTVDGVSADGAIDGTSSGANAAIGGNDVRKNLAKQFNDLRDQLDKFADDASFNGINLLRGDKLKLTFNETGTSTIEIQAKDASGNATSVNNTALGIEAVSASDFDSDAGIDDKLDVLKGSLDSLRSQASTFGSNLSVVENRQDFTKNMINTLETGAANLTLADTNEEAANLLALQTRQQLSSTALSMASQADQAVLRLF